MLLFYIGQTNRGGGGEENGDEAGIRGNRGNFGDNGKILPRKGYLSRSNTAGTGNLIRYTAE